MFSFTLIGRVLAISRPRKSTWTTYEWSLACWSTFLVVNTAIGDFFAMVPATWSAARTTSSLPPGTTLETRPIFSASAAEKLRAVYASSCTMLWFPAIFGRRASVPISAAKPTSTSCGPVKASATSMDERDR